MYRETDLIDVWFDSGAMPYAQHHYPFENRDLFEDDAGNFTNKWVADFIAEGVDQTRGWFYTLHAIATMCFDSVAYKAVVSNGLVLDSAGRKMSKRWGNAVEPFKAISMYGADAVRWYMITNAQPWDDLRFSWTKIYTDAEGKTHTFDPEVLEKDKDFYKNMSLTSELSEGIIEVYRSLFGTLYHTYNFFATYANADGFENAQAALPLEQRDELDRWIISLLNTLIKEVETDFSNYEPTQAGRKVSEFVDTHLSNWYVRLSRRRFWNKGDLNQTSAQELDKLAAYQTLHECLLAITKMMAPIAPFFADWMYRNLNPEASYEPHDSVHLALFPVSNPAYIDKGLEQRMDYAQRFASLVLSLRKKEKVRVRQPLQKMLIPVLNPDFQAQMEKVAGIILTEVNIKELEFIHDTSGLVKKRVRPNFKVLGKKLGADMKNAQAAIEAMTQADILSLEKTGTYALQIGEKTYQIEPADVQISSEDIEGWMVANDGELVVALDMHISPELFAEGLARELVNRIQNMRKEQKLDVTDKIQLTIQPHASLEMTLDKFGTYICNETQATVFKKEILTEHVPEMELLEGLNIRLDVQKIG
jgi:isoleucyl-tRNA synthetase